MNYEDLISTILAAVVLCVLIGFGIWCAVLYIKHEHKLDVEYKKLRNKALKKYLGIENESTIIK